MASKYLFFVFHYSLLLKGTYSWHRNHLFTNKPLAIQNKCVLRLSFTSLYNLRISVRGCKNALGVLSYTNTSSMLAAFCQVKGRDGYLLARDPWECSVSWLLWYSWNCVRSWIHTRSEHAGKPTLCIKEENCIALTSDAKSSTEGDIYIISYFCKTEMCALGNFLEKKTFRK